MDILRFWVAAQDKIEVDVDFVKIDQTEFDYRNFEINVVRKCLWNLLGLLKNYAKDPNPIQPDQLSFVSHLHVLRACPSARLALLARGRDEIRCRGPLCSITGSKKFQNYTLASFSLSNFFFFFLTSFFQSNPPGQQVHVLSNASV